MPLVICPLGNINLAVTQCLALEGYGMSQSLVTPAYIHTESCIPSSETEKFQRVHLLVVPSETSEWGPPKNFRI